MPPKDLTPRDGVEGIHIPKQERMTPDQKALMQQVEDLTKSESAALAVLAQASLGTQAATEDMADRLREIVDILVKAMQQFGVPLPAALTKAIAEKDYDPDFIDTEEDDEDDDDDDDAAHEQSDLKEPA